MELTKNLFDIIYEGESRKVLTTFFNHSNIGFARNIDDYVDLLLMGIKLGMKRIGIIVEEKVNFNTLSLIYAAIHCKITPIIISRSIGESIKEILEKEKIGITFYETLIKPHYLPKYDEEVFSDERGKWYSTINPYFNVNTKNFRKLEYSLNFIPEAEKLDCICKMYSIHGCEIKEEIVEEKDIKNYNEILSDINDNIVLTTLPLYRKEGFLFINNVLFKNINVICLDKLDSKKNLNKILKYKPSIITVDEYMLLELEKEEFSNVDLSFVKKAIVPTNLSFFGESCESDMLYVSDILYNKGFDGTLVGKKCKQKTLR